MRVLTRRHIISFLCLSQLVLSTCYALNLQCYQRIVEHQYSSTTEHAGMDVAVVDIGSSNVKLYLKKGGTETIEYYPVHLGERLGKSNVIDDQTLVELKAALTRADRIITQNQLRSAQIDRVATAGIRDALNRKQILKQLSDSGFKIRLLSEEEEAELVYRSVTKGQALPPAGAVVIDVGGGTTSIVSGKTFLERGGHPSITLHAGSDSLGISNPFLPHEIEGAAARVRTLLNEKSSPFLMPSEASGFISRSPPINALQKLHFERTGEDFFKTGLTDHVIDFYLSPEGLQLLKATKSERLRAVVSKLMVLREVKAHFRLPSISFGASGGLKDAVARELEANIVKKHIDRATNQLVEQWRRSQGQFIETMTQTFNPEKFGKWRFRVKHGASLESKLTTKWINGRATLENLSRVDSAHEYIGDGIGGRLTLDGAAPHEMQEFYSDLLSAVRTGKFKITAIRNYRGVGGIPYLSDAQVSELALAVKESTGFKPMINIGEQAEKTSGYTAFHINLIDSSGAPVEVQVRGRMVSQLSDFEHNFYDIRQGKAMKFLDPILIRTVRSLGAQEQEDFLSYIRECYEYARKVEQHQLQLKIPKLPQSLSAHPELSAFDVILQ